MSGKTDKIIRNEAKKQVANLWSQAMIQVLNKMELTAKESSFFKRVKLATRYVFKKSVSGFLGE